MIVSLPGGDGGKSATLESLLHDGYRIFLAEEKKRLFELRDRFLVASEKVVGIGQNLVAGRIGGLGCDADATPEEGDENGGDDDADRDDDGKFGSVVLNRGYDCRVRSAVRYV